MPQTDIRYLLLDEGLLYRYVHRSSNLLRSHYLSTIHWSSGPPSSHSSALLVRPTMAKIRYRLLSMGSGKKCLPMGWPQLHNLWSLPFHPKSCASCSQRISASQWTKRPASQDACYKWNTRDRCDRTNCQFSHSCLWCGGHHQATACPSTPRRSK